MKTLFKFGALVYAGMTIYRLGFFEGFDSGLSILPTPEIVSVE